MNSESSEILSEDVAIVMQGSIVDKSNLLDSDFVTNLDIVVKNFPSSQIIISTWIVSSNIEKVLHEKYPSVTFIYNEDVGPIVKDIGGVTVVSNLNRMLVSTSSGLNFVIKKYVIKIRTDSYLFSTKILNVLTKLHSEDSSETYNDIRRDERFSIFNKHIINCNLFARNPHSYLPFLYHPGDIMMAGETKDLQLLFNIPLGDESLIGMCKSWRNSCYMLLVPEQYLWLKCIETVTGVKEMERNFTNDSIKIERSERFYLNNFVPFNSKDLGFEWCKHKSAYYGKGLLSVYTLKDWDELYKKYILGQTGSWDMQLFCRYAKIVLMKNYFFIRTQLLNINFVRKLAFKFFVRRGH
jgi:hypothetical protein